MKIKSLELPSGLIVNFLPTNIALVDGSETVVITPAELETIRDTVRANQRAENLSKESAGGNGTEVVNKKEKAI